MDQLSARQKVRESLNQNHKWVISQYKKLGLVSENGTAKISILASAFQSAANLTVAEMVAEAEPYAHPSSLGRQVRYWPTDDENSQQTSERE